MPNENPPNKPNAKLLLRTPADDTQAEEGWQLAEIRIQNEFTDK